MNESGKITTDSPEETVKWGKEFAAVLKPGDTILLIGDLGAGKTVVARGIARGIGYSGIVSSPSFSLVKIYRGRLTMNHCDLYRLDPESDLRNIGLEEMIEEENSITVFEWGENFPPGKTMPRWEIRIEITGGINRRQINWKNIA